MLDNLSLRCFKCQKKRPLGNNCPRCRCQQGTHSLMTDLSFLIVTHDNSETHFILPSYIIFNTCTSRSVSNNQDMVTYITYYNEDECIRLHTNGGPTVFDKKAHLKVFLLKVYFKKWSMAMIISISDVCNIDGIRVIFDSHLDVHLDVILTIRQIYRLKRVTTSFCCCWYCGQFVFHAQCF